MKALFILLAVFISLECSAEDKKEQSQVKNQIALKAALMNDTVQTSQTAKYMNLSANCKMYGLISLAAAGAYAGAMSLIDFGADYQKNRAYAAGLGLTGGFALYCVIADIIYSKKAAKAAKMEIRPSHEGLGMNIAF